MVFIISTINEASTDNTIEWLIGNRNSFIRYNTESPFHLKNICLSFEGVNFEWKFNSISVNTKNINSVWFRRGYLPNYYYCFLDDSVKGNIENHLKNESHTLESFIHKVLSDKKSLNHPDCYNMNKLIALNNAVEAGFEIPDTLITQNNDELKVFKTKHSQLISKPIQDCIMVNGRMYGHICKVENNMESEKFSFSLFQQEIPKRVELRVFFLDGKCFTAAIFPHQQEQSIDGRILERKDDKLKRIVPFQLPEEQQDKIKKFMELLDLNCGSLDIILTPDNRYIFLEVNPVGQFDYVSKICNYYLEREIANYLSE